ncbi:LPXTG cell wall anchor domain-containing protein [Peptostreptococcus porci]
MKQTRLPKTGDSTNLFYYLSILVLSGGLILVIKLRKNKMKN